MLSFFLLLCYNTNPERGLFMYEKEIQLVGKLLESYTSCWNENYYNNKKTLKINMEKVFITKKLVR